SREGREVVSPQLQRCAEPRMHGRRKGRCAELAAHSRTLKEPAMGLYHRNAVGPLAVLALAAAVAASDASRADEPTLSRAPLLNAYQEECGACHLPYPPGLLPAASWQRIMQDLAHHFGTDASLDAATA